MQKWKSKQQKIVDGPTVLTLAESFSKDIICNRFIIWKNKTNISTNVFCLIQDLERSLYILVTLGVPVAIGPPHDCGCAQYL